MPCLPFCNYSPQIDSRGVVGAAPYNHFVHTGRVIGIALTVRMNYEFGI